MIRVAFTSDPIDPFVPDPPRSDAGAEIIFHGCVRGAEAARDIVALDYEQYEGMAEAELEALAAACVERFGLLDLSCTHRIGRVPVGDASMRIVLRSRHRGEGIEALDWFIRELKARVPIWKWGVTAGGERFPTHGPRPAPGEQGAS